MTVTASQMLSWTQALLGVNPNVPKLPLADYLKSIPRLEALASLPSGTPVLVRGDVDAKPGPTVGDGDIRLRSMKETLEYGKQRGWKMVVFGHQGRKPDGSLAKVAARLGEILGQPCQLIKDWLDESTMTVSDEVTKAIAAAAPGSVLVLEHVRRYEIETALWKAKPESLPALSEKFAALANSFRDKVAKVYVNEALSAGSLDASCLIVPAAMDQSVLGKYVAHEFDGPMMQCLRSQLVVFSGLKIDKLDDLEAMIARGMIKVVFTAGSLSMALRKASAELAGQTLCIGVAEDPAHADKPCFIPRERIEQAKQMLKEGQAKGIQFVLPVDSILQEGQASDVIGPGDQQFDVGPKTSELFAAKIGEFIAQYGHKTPPSVAFYNGVFGMFEDPRFEEGTRKFIHQLKRLKDAGIEVYVGGGEGGAALEKYGQDDWITHCFTAGGTVLNALGSEPVPYLVALKMAAHGN